MAIQYSIQKMISDGTLSTIALGIQYLQRNDIYMRVAGGETPQSGAPSGYTWSFLDNTTLKILPVVPNGVEVVVYRRTDVDAMYNIYSQNAQFDEATIDENNQQLLYIAQEYLEQGLPGTGVDTIEYVRDDGSFTYYRMRRTDGSYSEEFTVPSASNSTKVLTRESLRRSYAEAGYTLVDGSFEAGGTLVNANDVLLQERTGKAFSGPAGTVATGTNPAGGGFVDRSNSITVRCRDVGELEQINPSVGPQRAYLSAVNAGASGGAGYMIFDPASTDTEYQGVVVKPPMLSTGRWKRESKEDLSFYHFGAYGDGSHDDTQAALDWFRWQLESGKTKPNVGSGDFLVTSQLPFFNRGSVFGSGYDTNFVIGLGDNDTLFDVPSGDLAYSWMMDSVRFTCASGGSLRCRIFNVNGSLRGAKLSNVSAWEFSRPLRFGSNVWGNLVLDSVNLYRINNDIQSGDIAIEFTGNTLMGSNIEIIGAFDRLLRFSGSVFKLDGMNPSGSQSPRQAGSGLLIENARGGYVRSSWIEHVDAGGVSNGEAEAITVKDSTNVTLENIHIPTGSIWVYGGNRNTVRNIEYFQANAGLRLVNNAIVNTDSTALGNRNASTDDAKRGYSQPRLTDGNNSGKGLLPNPIDPLSMTTNVTKTNAALVTLSANTNPGDYLSGTQSVSVVTTAVNQGVKVTAPVIPGKTYTVCASIKKITGDVFMSAGANTSAQTTGNIYVDRSDGAVDNSWLLLTFTCSSSTSTLEVLIRDRIAGQFLLDAVDVYAGPSSFNPSNIG